MKTRRKRIARPKRTASRQRFRIKAPRLPKLEVPQRQQRELAGIACLLLAGLLVLAVALQTSGSVMHFLHGGLVGLFGWGVVFVIGAAVVAGVELLAPWIEVMTWGRGLGIALILVSSIGLLPDEDEQVAMLEQVVSAMGDRPVILRTLDVGADKPLPALPQPPEANPALGVRGLRLQLLRRPDLLLDQMRAALRVGARGSLRLMLPMVSTIDEVRQAKQLLTQARRELEPTSGRGTHMALGIMVEVPAAAVGADQLAQEVDFFSLGTNDLTQYLFAADRTNPEVASLADGLHPVVLRMIEQVVSAAHRHGRWVGVCGEMASDLWAVPLLVGLGVDELSVHPPLVARIKATVRKLDNRECASVARVALTLDNGQSVRRLLEERDLAPAPRPD